MPYASRLYRQTSSGSYSSNGYLEPFSRFIVRHTGFAPPRKLFANCFVLAASPLQDLYSAHGVDNDFILPCSLGYVRPPPKNSDTLRRYITAGQIIRTALQHLHASRSCTGQQLAAAELGFPLLFGTRSTSPPNFPIYPTSTCANNYQALDICH